MSRVHGQRRNRRDGGFTLLELLIAMTLLGVVMLAIFGGLRLGARVWEAGEDRADARTRVEIAQRFLRTYLGQANPLVRADPRTGKVTAFSGRSDGVEFVALLPTHLSGGGFDHVVIEAVEDGEGNRLVVRHGMLAQQNGDAFELAGADEDEVTTLVEGFASAEFSFFGKVTGATDPQWHDRWTGADGLPQLVRLHLAFPDGDRRVWPDMIAAPKSAGADQSLFSKIRRDRK